MRIAGLTLLAAAFALVSLPRDVLAQNKEKTTKKARRAADLPQPDHADLSYGTHPNNKIDLWLAKSDKPTPLRPQGRCRFWGQWQAQGM